MKSLIINFSIITILFVVGMITLIDKGIYHWLIWIIYFITWTIIEVITTKNIKIKLWNWLVIFLIVFGFDYVAIQFIS